MLSWTPIRNGKVFCSPACGRGCTYAEYRKATMVAEMMVKQLGKGWRTHVFENLGWHNEVEDLSGAVTVSKGERVHKNATYYAAINDPRGGGMLWSGYGTTAQAAIAAAKKCALAHVKSLQTILKRFDDVT